MRLGVVVGRSAQSGSLVITYAMVSDTVSPENVCRPESISKRTTPNDQISARRSAALPLACSGDMYPAVPRMMWAAVAARLKVGELAALACGSFVADAGSNALASPKSSTLTEPVGVILMLAGFRSR